MQNTALADVLKSIFDTPIRATLGPVIGGGGPQPSSTFYIRPTAQGANNGSSWADAMALKDLPLLLSLLQPNGTIYLSAYDGAYTIDSTLNKILLARPALAGPATIKGVKADLSPDYANFNSVRVYTGTYHDRNDNPVSGYDVFQFGDTTDLTMAYMNFTNLRYGFHLGTGNVASNHTRLILDDMKFNNTVMALNAELSVTGGSAMAVVATLDDCKFRRWNAFQHELGVIRIGQTCTTVTLEDVIGDGNLVLGSATSIPEGIHITIATLAVITRCRQDNHRYGGTSGSTYWNGDGFATERNVVEVQYTDCEANGNSDGGWDDKAGKVTYTRCIGRNNRANWRCWSQDPEWIDSESHRPFRMGGNGQTACHIQKNGGGSNTHVADITRMIFTGNAAREGDLLVISDSFTSGDTLTINFTDYDCNVTVNTPVLDNDTASPAIVPTINYGSPAAGCPAINTGTNRVAADANSYEAEAVAWFTAAPDDLSITWKQWVSTFIAALKAASAWTTNDVFYITACLTEAAALINLKAPGTNDLTKVGTVTWTRKKGFSVATGDITSELETGLAANAGTNNFTRNDNSFGCLITDEVGTAGTNGALGTDSSGTATIRINPLVTSNSQLQGRDNSTSSVGVVLTRITAKGLTIINRIISTSVLCYRDTDVTSSPQSNNSAVPVATTFKVLPKPSALRTCTVGAAYYGAGLETVTKAPAVRAAWKTFANKIIPGLVA